MALEVLISKTWFMRLSMACMHPHSYFCRHPVRGVKALIQAELQDSKVDDRAPEADDKAASKQPVV